MSEIEHQRGRATHERGTKEARKGHEKGMVRARFFTPSTCTTPAPTSACAAGKKILFRDVTDLPNEPTPPPASPKQKRLRVLCASVVSLLLRIAERTQSAIR